LIVRHQLAVLQRQQRRPELNWADRALFAALLGVIPKARRHGLRLLVTPDTNVRWHRDIVRRRWAAWSMRGKAGRPATPGTSQQAATVHPRPGQPGHSSRIGHLRSPEFMRMVTSPEPAATAVL
jgi:hypothetical protein